MVVVVLIGGGAYFALNRQAQGPYNLVIERISPIKASVGEEISIIGSGFTSTKNSLQFGSGFSYINNLVSSDGKTITFTLPESFDTCNPDGSVCAGLLSRPLPGQMYEVVVINTNGRSNPVNFTVTSGSKPISPTPTPNGGTGSVKSGTETVQPEDPNKVGLALYPDLTITSLPTESVSVKFIVEHRSALNSKSIKVRGIIVGTLLGERACPPDRGMCAQPSIFLADTTEESRNKLYDLRVLVNEEGQEKNYPVGKTIEIQIVVNGSKVAVVAHKAY